MTDLEKLIIRRDNLEKDIDRLRLAVYNLNGLQEGFEANILEKLEKLFSEDSRYFCPKCGKPVTVGTSSYYEDIYPRARCTKCTWEDKGPGFLYEIDAALDWYNKHKDNSDDNSVDD